MATTATGLGALLAAIVVALMVISAVAGWLADATTGIGDPDSMMRLVEVRDFLAGQGWYDLVQHRLAPPLGVVMHWSRYVDAPIAGLISLASLFVDRVSAETFAVNVWPPLLLAPFALGLVAVVHRFAGWTASFLTLLLLGMSPSVLILFRPGDIDHHNVQAVLLVWLIAGLVRADRSKRWAAVAGLTAATSLAIGLETLPAVMLAVAGLIAAWIHDGDRWRAGLITYALTLAAATALHFLATVPPDRWLVPACDALSPVYLSTAALGGLGLSAIAWLFRGRNDGMPGLLMRGGALLTLASFLVALVALAFPACLAGPYGDVDPRLWSIWLDHVSEAQGVVATALDAPWRLPLVLAPFAATAACLLGLRLTPRPDRPAYAILLAILCGSVLLGCVQLRGLVGAQVLASAGLGITAAGLFRLTAGRDDIRAVLTRWSWALATPVVWLLAGEALVPADPDEAGEATMQACRTTFADVLAPLEPAVVAATSNFGSHLLYRTPHAVLAAPYHRDGAGILAVDALLTAADGQAEMTATGASYLAVCLGDPELALIAERAPKGLAARLIAGERPEFLASVVERGPALILTPVEAVRKPTGADGSVTGSLPVRPGLGLRGGFAD
jgi:hypothetical protein